MTEWIKCSERMPGHGLPVLVVGNDVVQKNIYEWDGSTWQDWRGDYDECPESAFTHWMPLPEPPTE